MISRYKVWLNGDSLEEISPNIYINDISYGQVSPRTPRTVSAERTGSLRARIISKVRS